MQLAILLVLILIAVLIAPWLLGVIVAVVASLVALFGTALVIGGAILAACLVAAVLWRLFAGTPEQRLARRIERTTADANWRNRKRSG